MSSMSVKIGYVRLSQRGKYWQVAFVEPKSGKRVRMAIKATGLADARRQATDLHDEIAAGRFSGRSEDVGIVDALKATIVTSRGNDETKYAYAIYVDYFVKWLEGAHPDVTTWGQLTPTHFREWVAKMVAGGVSRATMTHYMLIPQMTSRRMAQDDPARYRDVAAGAKLPKDERNVLDKRRDEKRKALGVGEFRALIEFARGYDGRLVGPMLLQGMAGLRVREAVCLRECDVDFGRGVVAVDNTPTHKLKNRMSAREIPVAGVVLAELRRAIAELPIGDRTRPIFGYWAAGVFVQRYERVVRKMMRQFAKTADGAALMGYQVHWLRGSFVSAVRAAGVDVRTVQRYVGHSLGDVLGEHYEVTPEKAFAGVVGAIEGWARGAGQAEAQTR